VTAIGYGDDPDPTSDTSHPAQTYQDDDIRVEYHPGSGRSTDHFKVDEYRQSVPDAGTIPEPEPWAPFRSREDFEFTEIALETGMTRGQTDALIKLFHRCIGQGEGNFTLVNHKDMADTLEIASNRLAKVRQIVPACRYVVNWDYFKFQKRTITPKYKKQPREYEVWVRPILDWAQEMLQDEDLIHHFVWDAQRVSKFDSSSGSWVRIFDEPWTADRFWEIQVGSQ